MKNIVIVQDINFEIRNYNDTERDFIVNAYAQDPDETDMYTVEIKEIKEDGSLVDYILYMANSDGDLTDDADVLEDDLVKYVHNILFIKREHGIIRGF